MQPASESLPRTLLLSIAFVQGLLLLAIYRALESHHWPWHQPVFLYPLVTLALATPTLCLLSFTQNNNQHYIRWIGVFSLCLAAVSAYTGAQLEPAEQITQWEISAILSMTLLVACFKALMYIQQIGGSQPVSYSMLFRYSWRNFLVLGFSNLFTLIFWGILMLCGALFSVIKIDFFNELFKHDWFYIPVLSLANGLGIIIFRNMVNIIDTVAKILQALMTFLLPALILVAVIFLLALPVTGLQSLWGTGHGSLLILWLQLLILFFLNAVYQDESHILPYPRFLHRAIYCGVALLPVYSVIAFIGLYARVNQYGFSVERCWALLLWGLFALFALGYLWGIIKRRDQWIEGLSYVNIRMGFLLMALMLLVNSPAIDFRKISLASQLHRFEVGITTPENFDVNYVARNLGRPGYLVLENLKTEYAGKNPDFVKRIESVQTQGSSNIDFNDKKAKPTEKEFADAIVKYPADAMIPPDLLAKIYADSTKNDWDWKSSKRYYLIKKDLNDDALDDYIFIRERSGSSTEDLWTNSNGAWQSYPMAINKRLETVDVISALKEQKVEVISASWKELKIGTLIFSVSEKE